MTQNLAWEHFKVSTRSMMMVGIISVKDLTEVGVLLAHRANLSIAVNIARSSGMACMFAVN